MERLSLDTSATISEGDLRVYEVSPLECEPWTEPKSRATAARCLTGVLFPFLPARHPQENLIKKVKAEEYEEALKIANKSKQLFALRL